MKPDFALDFRDNQIALLHRQEAGWAIIGRVAMDDPDLDAAMAYLRATALGLSPRGVATKLVLPNDAILYTEVEGLPFDPARRAAGIADALLGRTPYDVADLVYDWTDAGTSAHVAVIARETLDEAEGFATQHRFNPVSFAALPNAGGFDGEVWFGATQLSETLLARGEVVERDDVTLLAPEAGPAAMVAAEASDFEMGADLDKVTPHEPTAEAEPDPAPEPSAEPDPMPEESPLPAAQRADESEAGDDDGREVWQDFIADDPAPQDDAVDLTAPQNAAEAARELDPAPEPQAEPVATDDTPADPPASFDAAMDETPEPELAVVDVPDEQVEEAPMAVDVPLMDEVPSDPSPAEAAPEAFGEKPQSRAEKMLAAFAARRADALAKAEADTNAGRIEPVLRAAKGSDAQPSLPLDAPEEVAQAAAIAAPTDAAPITAEHPAAPLLAAQPNPPKLGAPDAKLGRAPDIGRPTALTPPVVQHLPAKPAPTKPQDLKSMPKAKPAKSGGAMRLGWILTAILLLALVTASALSEMLLSSYNALFAPNTAIVSVEPAPETPASETPAAEVEVAAATTAAPASAPAIPTATPAAAPAPAALAQTMPPASRPDLTLPVLPQAAEAALTTAQTPPLLPEVTRASSAVAATAISVVSGRPALVPSPRPDVVLAAAASAAPAAAASATAPTAAPALPPNDPSLAGAQPLARPAAVLAAAAAAAPAGPPPAADPALAGARPSARPDGILAAGRAARLASAPASIVASAEAAVAEAALNPAPLAADPNRSPMAVSVSRIPAPRPAGLQSAFDAALAAAAAAPDPAPEVAPAPAPEPAPEDVASNAAPADEAVEEDVGLDGRAGDRSVVARQSTQRNMLNLREANLVGIFGSKTNRYALIRQPSGSFRRLKVGDRFDGGRIAAITESEVRYEKGGELLALRMPRT